MLSRAIIIIIIIIIIISDNTGYDVISRRKLLPPVSEHDASAGHAVSSASS